MYTMHTPLIPITREAVAGGALASLIAYIVSSRAAGAT